MVRVANCVIRTCLYNDFIFKRTEKVKLKLSYINLMHVILIEDVAKTILPFCGSA